MHRTGALSSWAKRLQYYVYETVGAMRIGQFFDIVVGLPESLPALADVRGCLQHTNSHARFIQRFGAAISQRLLHPGLLQRFILNPESRTPKHGLTAVLTTYRLSKGAWSWVLSTCWRAYMRPAISAEAAGQSLILHSHCMHCSAGHRV